MTKIEAEGLLRELYESRDEIHSEFSYDEYIRVLILKAHNENISFTPTKNHYGPFTQIFKASGVVE